jgi:hypothetical protein
VPPQLPAYQVSVPPVVLALSMLVEPRQMVEGVATTVVGVAVNGETVTVTERHADGEQLVLSVRA